MVDDASPTGPRQRPKVGLCTETRGLATGWRRAGKGRGRANGSAAAAHHGEEGADGEAARLRAAARARPMEHRQRKRATASAHLTRAPTQTDGAAAHAAYRVCLARHIPTARTNALATPR